MKYVLVNFFGITEIRDDSYELPTNAIELTDTQYSQLLSGSYILQNGSIIVNPIIQKVLPQ